MLMPTLWRHQLLLGFVAVLVFFTNLGGYALFDEDEPRNAVCGREMFERNDWIVPTFNAQLRTDKPILIYWLMQVSFRLFGVSEFAARFGSAFLAVGATLLTYHLGRKLYSPEIGLLAGVIVCTSLMFSAVGRSVTPDSVLIFCLTLSFTSYVWAVAARRGGHFSGVPVRGVPTDWTELVPASRVASLPMYAAMGLAILAKGPIGVLLPCTIIGLLLLISLRRNDLAKGVLSTPSGSWWRRSFVTVAQVMRPTRILAASWQMRVLLGAAVVLAIALPWYVAVGLKTDGAWLQGFLGDHNVGRFLGAKENHSGPIFYYVIALFLGCFPWSVFLPLAVWQLRIRLVRGDSWGDSDRFVACWAGVWFVFFSFASTKLPNYVLPMYPALALISARYLHDWQQAPAGYGAVSFRHCCRMLAVVAALMMVAIPITMSILLPGEEWLLLIGAIPLMGAALAFAASQRERRPRAIRILSASAIVLAVLIVGIAPTRVGPHQDSPKMAEAARRAAGTSAIELASIDYFSPNLVYYAGHPVQRLAKPDDVAKFFAEHPRGFVIARSDKLKRLTEPMPQIVEVARHRRFLRNHDLVLLGHLPEVALHKNPVER
jgi:4-amino-4-deoxy-L-arabinose transferase-like glycosyltransferase